MGVPNNTDLFIVERSGVQYQATAAEVKEFVGQVSDLTATSYANALAGTFNETSITAKTGDRVFVPDASGDASVDAGWAVYRIDSVGPVALTKISEQESMDVVIVTVVDLSVTRTAAAVTVVNSAGDDAVIPLADSVNAGLMSPAAFLDIHPAATSALTAATNPITVDDTLQSVGFSIAQLDPLP